MPIRHAAVSGSFYAGSVDALRRQIENCFIESHGPGHHPKVNKDGKQEILGLVSPHAGYMYSGYAAAYGYDQLAADGKPDVFVILAPNHHGWGAEIALMSSGRWETPLGMVDIDGELAANLLDITNLIEDDVLAHTGEHSIEVQLPFLQYLYGNTFKFLPVTMMTSNPEDMRQTGLDIAEAVKGRNVVIIASTDFSHYVPANVAREKDGGVISKIVEIDPGGMLQKVREEQVGMCGYAPVAAMLYAVEKISKCRGDLLKYMTSGDITGDNSSVVGYASIKVSKTG